MLLVYLFNTIETDHLSFKTTCGFYFSGLTCASDFRS